MAISWLNGVISVREDLFGETFILFEVSQSSRVCMYCCRLAAAVLYCGCCVLIVYICCVLYIYLVKFVGESYVSYELILLYL